MNKSIIFVTPVFPSFTGNGLAMRAAASLKLLSNLAPVHLLVIPVYTGGADVPSPEIARLCCSWSAVHNPDWRAREHPSSELLDIVGSATAVPREWRWCNTVWQHSVREAINEINPDLVFVFRFYLTPFVLPAVQSSTPCWLDVDELESCSRARLSAVYLQNGEMNLAAEIELEALGYEKLEVHFLRSFKRVFAASQKEANGVLERWSDAVVRVLPNTYPYIRPHPQRKIHGSARLLFVGSLGYYPNADAVRYFLNEILPVIKDRSPLPVEVCFVGGGDRGRLLNDSEGPSDVVFAGAVPNTTPFYADCDVVIVPLRSAGGTRIKILEAFSHARAVVATSIGAEGLECVDEFHLDIADSADEFAARCLRLIQDAEHRQRQATNGHDLFKRRYAMPNLEAVSTYLFAN